MQNFSVSSLENLNAALLEQNPFAKPPFLNAKDVWGQEFFDVETINIHASDAVFQSLEEIRSGQYSTTSIVLTAQDGTGKTHIISRIRHQLQNRGGGLFVYANKYGELSQIKQGFQKSLAESLGKVGYQGVTQWQELATAIVNHISRQISPHKKIFSPQELIQKFSQSDRAQTSKWIESLTKNYPKTKDVNDPDIVKAIFWTLTDESLYAIKWLEGQELAQQKSNELQLPSQRQSFDAVLQILDLISEYNELVVCFDELDTPDAYDEISGLHISQIVAGLIKDLLQNLNRGIVLSVMMPAQWSNKIKQLPGGVYNKISARGNPLDLKYMDGKSIVDLVSQYLQDYYKTKNLVPPYPIYPFIEAQLLSLGKGKPTIREVLKWCRENCKSQNFRDSDNKEQQCPDPVEIAFSTELENDLGDYLDDNYLLADALFFGFQTLIGQIVEKVKIQEVSTKIKKRGGKDRYINFKIIGEENGKNISIGVAVLQYAGGKTLGAGMRRLNKYDVFGITRGCLVRSQSKKITTYLKQKYLNPLIEEKGGEFVHLKEEEIKPLIAIRAVHQKREVDYEVSEEQILQFITEKGAETMLGANNPLLQEILSAPSYQLPKDLIEDEPVTVAESIIADASTSDEVDIDSEIDNLLRQFTR